MIITLDVSAAIEFVMGLPKQSPIKSKLEKANLIISPSLYIYEASNTMWKYNKIKNYPEKISKAKGDYSIDTLFTQILVARTRLGKCNKIRINAKEKEDEIESAEGEEEANEIKEEAKPYVESELSSINSMIRELERLIEREEGDAGPFRRKFRSYVDKRMEKGLGIGDAMKLLRQETKEYTENELKQSDELS